MTRRFVLWCRLRQAGLRAIALVADWAPPRELAGAAELAAALREGGHGTALVVTDAGIRASGIADEVLGALSREGVRAVVYDKVTPNPTVGQAEEARAALAGIAGCRCVVAVGGGSPMDCAKAACALTARPGKSLAAMRGVLRVCGLVGALPVIGRHGLRLGCRRLPELYAVPTTAGTGSEATLACVITDPARKDKYAISDLALIPKAAVLDPRLTAGMPPNVTAWTGMDALSHAVEAFIGLSNTRRTEAEALEAARLVFRHLPAAYRDGGDLGARRGMQRAAFLAGRAFGRAYVGNCHAAAHALGGFYDTPHGLANALALPVVLERYGARAHARLARLWDACAPEAGMSPPPADAAGKAAAFIGAARSLAAGLGLPGRLGAIRAEDVPALSAHAFHEANPLYPVPVIFSEADFAGVFRRLMGIGPGGGASAGAGGGAAAEPGGGAA